jgi:hypothetical protein
MNGLHRTLDCIAGKPVDRPPFHPIIMQWAARYAGADYRDFCLKPAAEDFAIDWATIMLDRYCEAEAFGIQVDYPEDGLPIERGGNLPEAEAAYELEPCRDSADTHGFRRFRANPRTPITLRWLGSRSGRGLQPTSRGFFVLNAESLGAGALRRAEGRGPARSAAHAGWAFGCRGGLRPAGRVSL